MGRNRGGGDGSGSGARGILWAKLLGSIALLGQVSDAQAALSSCHHPPLSLHQQQTRRQGERDRMCADRQKRAGRSCHAQAVDGAGLSSTSNLTITSHEVGLGANGLWLLRERASRCVCMCLCVCARTRACVRRGAVTGGRCGGKRSHEPRSASAARWSAHHSPSMMTSGPVSGRRAAAVSAQYHR